MIEFAIGADVTEAFRAAVLATAESEWKPLIRRVDGKSYVTDQEWAEVGYVPTGPDTAASAPITASWRSASRCGNWNWGTSRSCRFPRRRSPEGRAQTVRRGDQPKGPATA